jgi:hypothetical protein
MSSTTDIHPDAVLESLLAKGGRSHRGSNLSKMHELCRKQHEAGSHDFSLPAIGHLAEAEGILNGRALYNAQSTDYQALFEAWAAYAGPPAPKPPKTLASYEYLMRIDDPAIRSIMQAIIAERGPKARRTRSRSERTAPSHAYAPSCRKPVLSANSRPSAHICVEIHLYRFATKSGGLIQRFLRAVSRRDFAGNLRRISRNGGQQ